MGITETAKTLLTMPHAVAKKSAETLRFSVGIYHGWMRPASRA